MKALIDKIDEIWTASQQTLTTGGSCIHFQHLMVWVIGFIKLGYKCEEGRGLFNDIKLHWTVHPEREQSWRDEQDELLGVQGAAQECDCDFLTSGTSVIDARILEECREKHSEEPVEKRGVDSNLWIWKQPDYTKNYVVCADVGRGDSKDYSAFHVIDVETVEQEVEYKGRIPTKDFGNMLVNISTEYNDFLLIIENNNIGWATIQQVIDREYPNLFYTSKDLRYVDIPHQMTNKYRSQEKYEMDLQPQ